MNAALDAVLYLYRRTPRVSTFTRARESENLGWRERLVYTAAFIGPAVTQRPDRTVDGVCNRYL